MLWALCAWRLRYRPEHPDLDVVVLGDAPEDGFSRGFVRVKPADARRGLSDAPLRPMLAYALALSGRTAEAGRLAPAQPGEDEQRRFWLWLRSTFAIGP